MAADHTLLECVQAGGPPVLRFYGWSEATLSFGRNQPVRGRIDPIEVAARRIACVRRPTGGAAVLHDQELTYALVVPVGLLGGPRQTYARAHAIIADALGSYGVVDVTTAPRRALAAGSVPRALPFECFRAAEGGELTARGRKLVGSAQRCERRVILQHGSILLNGEQPTVLAPSGAAPAMPPVVAITLAELLGTPPDPSALAQRIAAAFERCLDAVLRATEFSAAERARAARLACDYAAAAWTWRR